MQSLWAPCEICVSMKQNRNKENLMGIKLSIIYIDNPRGIIIIEEEVATINHRWHRVIVEETATVSLQWLRIVEE